MFFLGTGRCNGVIRPPVIFHSTLFPSLSQLNGDEGARKIFKSDIKGQIIQFNDEKNFQDIATPNQYQYFLKQSSFLQNDKAADKSNLH